MLTWRIAVVLVASFSWFVELVLKITILFIVYCKFVPGKSHLLSSCFYILILTHVVPVIMMFIVFMIVLIMMLILVIVFMVMMLIVLMIPVVFML